MPFPKTVIIIAGPTASGKTRLAIDLALRYETEIVSADSRQCYREMNIGVARPSVEELSQVRHHFIASHSIHDKVNAISFEQYALDIVHELFRTKDIVIMAGGTGLYLKAFCEGMDEIPDVPSHIREGISAEYEAHGLPWLQQQVQLLDPRFYSSAEIHNPRRLMRALEVLQATGRSVLDFRRGSKAERDFRIVKWAIDIPRTKLADNINLRVDRMMEKGLLEEVKSLYPQRHLNALQTVGYRELFAFIDGEMSLPAAVEQIKINTRQYAKRQLTWFRKDEGYSWTGGFHTGAFDPLAGENEK
ncbi:MAG TPA: tRNA (adenosine(37)-N6)-dimethylallyltransferase MiaA [Flavisolibacter sp.]|nr:tRNA (adenosine(37)-N6)-dimethylallyltransferase MiaA [Flavisolibacter sp.]